MLNNLPKKNIFLRFIEIPVGSFNNVLMYSDFFLKYLYGEGGFSHCRNIVYSYLRIKLCIMYTYNNNTIVLNLLELID